MPAVQTRQDEPASLGKSQLRQVAFPPPRHRG